MMHHTPFATATVALLSGIVIASPLRAQAAPTIRDSAGIRIVSHSALPATMPTVARVATTPLFTIGSAAGDSTTLLADVTSAVQLSSGTVAIANTRAAAVLFFDSNGRFISSAGRRGTGPGEFQSLSWIKKLGTGQVIAYDRARRVTIYGDSGRVVATGPLNGVPVGAFPDGTILWSTRMPRAIERDGASTRDSSLYQTVRQVAPNAAVDTLMMLPNSDLAPTRSVTVNGTTTVLGYNMPFGRTATAQISGEGFLFGDGSHYEIRFYSKTGVLRQIVRVTSRAQSVTAADMRAYAAARVADARPAARASLASILDGAPHPTNIPAYGRILVDDTGRIWVQSYTFDSEREQKWTLFDGAGNLLGQANTPARLEVFHIGTNRLLGLTRDADDVERVAVFELTRPGV